MNPYRLKTWPCDQHDNCILLWKDVPGSRKLHIPPELLPRIKELWAGLVKNAQKTQKEAEGGQVW